jgi:hypothetical protein
MSPGFYPSTIKRKDTHKKRLIEVSVLFPFVEEEIESLMGEKF